jgi:VCBS repeat-containing protein
MRALRIACLFSDSLCLLVLHARRTSLHFKGLNMAASAAKYKVSLGTRPQAKDDNFSSQQMTAVLGEGETFDVLANDLGGNAASLAWVGYADNALISHLGSDVSIASNMVSYVLTDDAIAKVQESTKGTIVEDTFTYMIQLGNGTYSTATATVYIEAVNHEATIVDANNNGKDDFKGSVTEDLNASSAGMLAASGALTVSDFDTGEAHFQAGTTSMTSSGATASGTFTMTESGQWSYTVDNRLAQVQALGAGESFTEAFTVKSVDGTEETVTVSVNGANESSALTRSHFGFEADTANWRKLGATTVLNFGPGYTPFSPNRAGLASARKDEDSDKGTAISFAKSELKITDGSLDMYLSNPDNRASAFSTTIDFVKNQTIKLQYKFDDVDSDTDGDALFLVYMNGRNILTLNDSQTTNGDWTGPYTLNTGNFESMAAVEISFVAISVGYDAGSFVYVDNLQIFN